MTYNGLGSHHDCREGVTIVVGQDEAPFGGDTQHGPALIKGKLVGPAGAPCLAGQLEGGDMMSVHAFIRQAEQQALSLPSLHESSLVARGLSACCKPVELTRASLYRACTRYRYKREGPDLICHVSEQTFQVSIQEFAELDWVAYYL